MAVLGIVPAEERSTERLGLALIPEPSGKRGMVLQGFEPEPVNDNGTLYGIN